MKIEDVIVYKGRVITLDGDQVRYYLSVYFNGELLHTTGYFESESDIPKELSIVTGMIYRGEI